MKKIRINGGKELTGTINIGGSKNSAVALIPASLLSSGNVTIDNIPNISDIDALIEILEYLGTRVNYTDGRIVIDNSKLENKEIPEEKSSKLRASYYFMSVLLARYKHVEMYFPGGCAIGARKIDQTLKGYKTLGATVYEHDDKFVIEAKELVGGHVYLDMPSVGATINTMLVATLAHGETIIDNAAKEPDVVSVAIFLNNMGAKITGAGTSEIKIQGVEKLYDGFTEVIPDRIEAGTYVIAGALVGNNLKINNVIPEHIESLLSKLIEMGVPLKVGIDSVTISKADKMNAVRIKTLGYPGFPTDLQQPITSLLNYCDGVSTLEETVYEDRFKNVYYLNQMGANIIQENTKIYITGIKDLVGKEIHATDLRAGAGLVLAGLKATGITTITGIEYILRGYENIIEKLTSVGASIELIEE